MAIAPKTIHPGTPEKKSLTITLEITSYAGDPKIVLINDSFETVTFAECDISGILNGLAASLGEKTGEDINAYFNAKMGTVFFQREKGKKVDAEASKFTW